jgi:hypothetical protein
MKVVKQLKGVTLIEVVLATGIAAVFLSAFMLQFRVQQSSYQAASDEMRLPILGFDAATRIIGTDGLGACFKPSGTAQNVHLAPRYVRFPITDSGGTTAHRTISFEESATDPLPAGSRPGKIQAQDSSGTPIDLVPGTAIASATFYSPEVVTNLSSPGGGVGVSGNEVTVGGQTAFYVLGAADPMNAASVSAATRGLAITHEPNSNSWTFGLNNGQFQTVRFSPGGVFMLNAIHTAANTTGGYLVCSWPVDSNPKSPTGPPANTGVLTYNLSDVRSTRRIGVWLHLNTSPFSGHLGIRDSAILQD